MMRMLGDVFVVRAQSFAEERRRLRFEPSDLPPHVDPRIHQPSTLVEVEGRSRGTGHTNSLEHMFE